ncbi:MAG: LD-carboxypeptidase [Bacteroidetes bacterium]|nr:LD-carboxypeptidase [Bacteroidota bacterium]
MITPPYLKKGDRIGVVSPARKVTFPEIHHAIKTFQGWGLEPVLAMNVLAGENQFAGSDQQRIRDLQQMMDDDTIRAVICTRGGYGTVRVIDHLDFTRFRKNPKWIIGFSDITVLHARINQRLHTETIHGIMPFNFSEEAPVKESIELLRSALFGEPVSYHFKPHPFSRPGNAKGKLAGGNLSILYSLMGSEDEIETEGKILFLEDLDEYLYHVDRMMMNLLRAGKLNHLNGLLVGGMNDMKDNAVPFGKSAYEIIAGITERFDYPVGFGFPAGHEPLNKALILGREITLQIEQEEGVTLFLD